MKKRFLGILAVLAVFCIALVGCGGSGKDYTSNFAGEWELVAMESEENQVSEEDLQNMKEMGLVVTLNLNEDGTANLVMFGEDYGSGEWSAKTSTTIDMTMEGQKIDVTLDPSTGRLRFAQGDEALIFVRAS